MTHPQRFVEELARLVRLLAEEPARVEEQKGALRRLRDAVRDAGATVATGPAGPSLDGEPPDAHPSETAAALRAVAERLEALGLRELAVRPGAPAAELLAAARRLAGVERAGRVFSAPALEYVRFGGPPDVEAVRPARPTPTVVRPFSTPVQSAAPLRSAAVVSAKPADARRLFGTPAAGAMALPDAERTDGLMTLAAPIAEARTLDIPDLFERLAACRSNREATSYLDELATRLELGVRQGRTELVDQVLLEIVRREGELADEAIRLAYTVAVRRMSAPSHLRIAARMLPRAPQRRETIMAVLGRAGEEGAEALIEQLVNAKSTADRRTYFNALVTLQAGVPSLMHMLGDERWYAVRNAADLLGELGATAADEALAAVAEHPDARVRRSVLLALGKLATPRARALLEEALRHPSPERRMVAAQAIAAARDLRSSAVLRRALEDEGDPAVQHTILAALGRLATRDAVEALALAAAPRRRLFRRKPSAYRVAAAHALADAGTPTALAALQRLCEDEDREVRAVAQRLSRAAPSRKTPANLG